MNSDIARSLAPILVAAVSALGGALIVFSEFDDAPGGMLIGLLLIVGAAIYGVRQVRRSGSSGRSIDYAPSD